MASTKGSYLGTESERIQAYYKDRSSNLKIVMLESRLDLLRSEGITEGAEVDSILEQIAIEQGKISYGWGLDR